MATLTQNFQEAIGILMADYARRAAKSRGDAILSAFPFSYVDSAKVYWDQWETNFGLTPLRGMGAKPDVVQFNGWKRYFADPAYFGQTTLLEEGEITAGVEPGTLGDPINVANRLGIYMTDTATMILNRARKSAADLWATGKIDITDTRGRRFQYQVDNYAGQIKVPGTAWKSSNTTATPIQDALGWKAALQKGTDSRFGRGSKWLMNSNTLTDFFSITQIISTYKLDYGGSILGLAKYNAEIAGQSGDDGFVLPQIEIYDEGYYPTAADAIAKTNWTYFVPNQTILWQGTRPEGQQRAQWQLTRHAGLVEQGKGGFDEVSIGGDDADIGKGLYVRCHYNNKQPHGYELESGWNGLPVMFFPSAFAVITYT
ncbi:hypothetical protein VT84_09315 [Gemmata sp. SH-PL17]|uniref:major capsid protein n=1 Tax=Gemmata sp. SH-PL17 TaxID=1630693 RepID=UPI00078D002D|nr:major capsid protein [Gemmata sp. SH-PL17]AMV24582.1 hypothetical protein VT84_09315 [Gemmata sp. SH-PL17]